MRSRFEIYCDILRTGLLNIRSCSNDRERCFTEADHLHNIPELLQHFNKEELHRFYWEVMRPSFISQCKLELTGFEQLWKELEAANQREG
jgi:hypothetical protein